MPLHTNGTQQLRRLIAAFVPHFRAVVDIEAHVVVCQPILEAEINLVKGRVLAQLEELEFGVVEQVYGR